MREDLSCHPCHYLLTYLSSCDPWRWSLSSSTNSSLSTSIVLLQVDFGLRHFLLSSGTQVSAVSVLLFPSLQSVLLVHLHRLILTNLTTAVFVWNYFAFLKCTNAMFNNKVNNKGVANKSFISVRKPTILNLWSNCCSGGMVIGASIGDFA